MKRFLLNLFTAALATAGLSLGSCSDDNDEGQKLPEPNFPAKTTLGIEVGGTCTIPISPNQAWSVSIDRTQAGEWFWLDDDGMPAYTVRGKAGDHEIVICVSDVEEHDTDRSIDITMTMGSESQVIATVTRGTVERQFDLYQGTESGFGEVTYEEEPIDAGQTTLTIPWEETSMEPERRPIKIAANFQWRLDSKPEWIAELSPSEGKAGETVEILLSGDPKAFPLEDSEDELVFCDYDNNDVKFAFRISIPGCKEKQDVTLNAGTVFSYNAAGEYGKGGAGSVTWTFYGPTFRTTGPTLETESGKVGYKVFVLEKKDMGGAYLYSVCNWITQHENVLSGDDVLVDTEYRLTAEANTGSRAAARSAAVVVLPAELAKDVTSAQDLLGQEPPLYMPSLKEAYKPYELATLNQDAPISSLFTVRDLAGLESTNTTFRQLTYSEDRDLPEQMAAAFGTPNDQNYLMSYASETSTASVIYSSSLNNFTTRFFDDQFAEIKDNSTYWLRLTKQEGVNDSADGSPITAPSFEVIMDNISEDKTGYIVFYVDDKPMAAFCCKTDSGSASGAFQAELISGDGATFEAVTFDNYQDMGSMLEDFVGKNLSSEFAEELASGTAIYLLGSAPDVNLKIKTSEFDPERLQIQPFEGIDWLNVELADETTFNITMGTPGAGESPYAMLNIYNGGYYAAGIIYCVPLP